MTNLPSVARQGVCSPFSVLRSPGMLTMALLFFIPCMLFASGCTTYTVLPADREVVPVAPQDPDPQGRRVYVEMEDGATGWFVPDSVMLELLEAD